MSSAPTAAKVSHKIMLSGAPLADTSLPVGHTKVRCKQPVADAENAEDGGFGGNSRGGGFEAAAAAEEPVAAGQWGGEAGGGDDW